MRLLYQTAAKGVKYNHRNAEYVIVFIACICISFRFMGVVVAGCKGGVVVNTAALIASFKAIPRSTSV